MYIPPLGECEILNVRLYCMYCFEQFENDVKEAQWITKRCVCVCVSVRCWFVELNCLSPTYCCIRVRCHSERQLQLYTTFSLSFAQQDATNPPSPPATNPANKDGHAHTNTAKLSQQRHDKDLTRYWTEKIRDENDFEVWTFLSSLIATLRVCVFIYFSPLLRGVWQKMCIKDGPQALYNTLIMRIPLCVRVINYLQALFLLVSEHCDSPNNKKQPEKSTYRAHILKTLRVPLHRLQL